MCNTVKEIWKTLLITHQGNSQVKDNKIDLLLQQYEQFVISEDESIDSAFARFNIIITSLKALDEGYASKNYISDRNMEKYQSFPIYVVIARKHAEFNEPDTYVLERFDTPAGNPVKKILLKLNLSDHRSILKDSKQQSVKVKEIQERCIVKAFQDYQIKKGMSMSVQKSQVHEIAKFRRWRNEIMLG
ncbi:hypothetical protein Tco_1336463 [Tanacetum coccineum]